ncbi:Serine/Threonine kinase domain protein (macronuclear) [Tetrahymena thermophila SB210]|uniref:Serine/Threonine kinase domain protein n=1 Tax=Tetrahymena thermophila (strain SB210) TaxID=312017 RepID=I7M9V0_TETTS|nr:Serine/Threonine kinase domain protein [Tetrahymena thermophila SB210]EAS02860.3 Serine/Threonine kinase domain protein [Tetrahymena thermophila SB210]|eukprot:XP_001023105.3 Serine/Threonine kinase domain protein [Tetrahymena thermophila SB210]
MSSGSNQKKVGNYQWSEQDFLGKGAFGSVFKGKNIETGEQVAVKVLQMQHFKNEQAKIQLDEEINVMKKLDSPYIVKLLGLQEENEQTVIILELCPEGDLNNLLKSKGGSLNEQEAINILCQLLLGFKKMVEQGYIHRDIKPANILIKDGFYKVSDFGFATGVDIKSQQLLKECVGTPLFMAPQLLRSKEYSSKSDIWSIGMMYYLMLFGKTPWPARDLNSFITNIELLPLRFPYDKPISQESKDFLSQCLQVEEESRIDWSKLFEHPLTKKALGPAQDPNIRLDERAKRIIRDIQELVQIKNLDIKQQFGEFAKNKKSLNLDEFHSLICKIDQRLTSVDTDYLFKQIDENGDGSLSIHEFTKFFLEYDFSDLTDKAAHIITDLKEIIKANKMNLFEIFEKYDENKGGTLDLQEFTKMLKQVANGLKDYEILVIFRKFDSNNDQNIDFQEFVKVMTYGLQSDVGQFDFSGEKALRVITELKRVIIENNLNEQNIFQKFDVDFDKHLNRREFRDLIRIIDHRLTNQEIHFIFDIFDMDSKNLVSLENFVQTLKEKSFKLRKN